jgi:hypothetical protein
MSGRFWLMPLAAAALFFATAGTIAQTVEPDEAVNASGTMTQSLALTAAQKSAIYNAVVQQKVRGSTAGVPAAIGATVPPTASLSELPEEAANEPWAAFLKYAMVEDDVVVVDPISMRVIDVIHRGARP